MCIRHSLAIPTTTANDSKKSLSLESHGPKNNNPLQVLIKVPAVGRHRHWNSHFIHCMLPFHWHLVQFFFFSLFVPMVNPLLAMSENDVCDTPEMAPVLHGVHLGSPKLQWHSHTKHHLGRCHPSAKIVWDTVTKLAFFVHEKSWWPCMWIDRSY